MSSVIVHLPGFFQYFCAIKKDFVRGTKTSFTVPEYQEEINKKIK